MRKFIREACKIAGIPPSEVAVVGGRRHLQLVYKGHKITCASTPKNADITAFNIARDFERIKSKL